MIHVLISLSSRYHPSLLNQAVIVERGLGEEARIARWEFLRNFFNAFDWLLFLYLYVAYVVCFVASIARGWDDKETTFYAVFDCHMPNSLSSSCCTMSQVWLLKKNFYNCFRFKLSSITCRNTSYIYFDLSWSLMLVEGILNEYFLHWFGFKVASNTCCRHT